MYDAANDAAIVRPLDPTYIRRQTRFDPLPLLIACQNRFLRMIPTPFQNRIRIVLSERKD